MGVTGLWSVLEPAGKKVRLQSLQGKVLAVDVSIWLHQSVKGFRDKDGNPLRNAHLLGVFFRVCKLLVYGIRPVFVFDGGVPALKKQTMAARRQRKIEAQDKSEIARNKLLRNLVRQQLQRQYLQDIPDADEINAEVERVLKSSRDNIDSAVRHTKTKSARKGVASRRKAMSPQKKAKAKPHDEDDAETFGDSFNKFKEKLTENFNNFSVFFNAYDESEPESSDSEVEVVNPSRTEENFDENFSAILSPTFDELPLNTQHEMLFELQEARKANSWGKLDQMPKESQSFSSFQLERLKKRHTLQRKIQSVQREMGQHNIHLSNFDELEAYNYEADTGYENQATVTTNETDKIVHVPNTAGPVASASNANDNKWMSINEGITIDDFVMGDWSSDDDVKEDKPKPLTEEEELQRAIQLSLEQFDEQLKKEDVKTDEIILETSSVPESNTNITIMSHSASFSDVPEENGIATDKLQKSEVKSDSELEESASDFEDVDANEEKGVPAPAMDMESLYSALKETPVLTVNISSADVEADDDIFADIFATTKDHKASCSQPAPKYFTLSSEGSASAIKQSKVLRKTMPTFSKAHLDVFKSPVVVEDGDQSEVKNSNAAIITLEDEIKDVRDDRTARAEHHVDLGRPGSTETLKIDFEIASEETIRPKATLGADPSKPVRMITAQYMQAQERLSIENEKLLSAKGFQERVATTITDQMYSEAQELLSLFGVPYIISPMEAEAQCAFLDTACLTEGTITDDSDVWLFGGRRVYKNFFSQGERPVELFQYSDIFTTLSLDREKMVLMALLTGSDYTVGVEGVGPVKALEIISEFNSVSLQAFDILIQFREWWEQAQKDRTLCKGNKLREQLRKIRLKAGFPNRAVWDAYFDPTVNDSMERFRWGKPDLDAIRTYTHEKFGWDEKKCAANLLPLTKMLQCQVVEPSRQITLDRFLSMEAARDTAPRRKDFKSKRMKEAMKKLKPVSSLELQLSSEDSSDEISFKSKKAPVVKRVNEPKVTSKRRKKVEEPADEAGNPSDSDDERELNEILYKMGVKRKKFKLSCSQDSLNKPRPSQARKALVLPKMKPSRALLADIAEIPVPGPSVKVTPLKQPDIIPQKVREEEKKKLNKKKAIDLLKKLDGKK